MTERSCSRWARIRSGGCGFRGGEGAELGRQMVPLSIVKKRGMKMDGSNPTLMRGMERTESRSIRPSGRVCWRGLRRAGCMRGLTLGAAVNTARTGTMGPEADQAEYVAGFHRLRPISDRQPIHFTRKAGGTRDERGRHHHRPGDHRAAGYVCGGGDRVGVQMRCVRRHAERHAQHSGIRNGENAVGI